MTLRDLRLRLSALVAPHRVERELDEELAFHIERETQKHIAAGLSPADARARARARFGPVPLAADQCRDARGVGVVDDLARDSVYAWRTFYRAPLAALTIVATVAVGLGLVAAVFTIYNVLFLRVDAVRSPGELFAVERVERPGMDEPDAFTRADYDALRRETNVFADVVAMRRPVRARVEGRLATAALVSGNFFHVLGAQAALGRPLTPGDDERSGGRPVIVLSHVGWSKLFADDPMVIGRRLLINRLPYEIVGVMPESFRGLGILPPDYWAPLALAGQFRDVYATRESETPVEIVARLKEGISAAAALAGVTVWASGRTDRNATPDQPAAVRLTPSQGTVPAATVTALLSFSPIFVAFGSILMIGCANVANLLLARGVSRQREIGIRLSLGASRRRVIRQLLTESLLLALVAAAGGVAVARLFLLGALHAVTTTIPPELFEVDISRFVPPAADWRLLLFLVAGAVASTVVFGLAPALQATRLALVRTMRGEVTVDGHPSRARHRLIALQVGASALLLICAAIALRGAVATATRGPGVRTSDTVRVSIGNEPRRAALLQAVRADPLVAVVAASSVPSRGVVEISIPSRRDAGNGGAAAPGSVPVDQLAVSSDYFDVLGIGVVSGRGFMPSERSAEAGVAIVSESLARGLWPNSDGVGQLIRVDSTRDVAALAAEASRARAESRTRTVVGVVRDPGRAAGASYLNTFRGVYLPTDPESPGTSLMLRVRVNPEQARLTLLERFASVDPASNIITLRTLAGLDTYMLRTAFWITVALGGLALVLTVSGLFSVLSYVVEQQAKEIGVRMALGAATNRIVLLVLSQSLRPVGSGLVAGSGLAVAAAILLMATSSELGGWIRLFDPVAYAASLLVIIVACALAVSVPALRAASIDPIATLRKD